MYKMIKRQRTFLRMVGEYGSSFDTCFCGTCRGMSLTHYQTTILDSSKLTDFADDNIELEENGRKLFEPVENTVGKGEIARHEQFLHFPQCFQKACFPGASKGVTVWEWVNGIYFLRFCTKYDTRFFKIPY